jgi:hypothetical protein
MKTKIRFVEVNNQKYGWSHSLPVRWGDGYEIRIWENKQIIHREKFQEWLGEELKPGTAIEIIKKRNL